MIRRFAIALVALLLLRADMYPDASNAVQPQALNNIAKVSGSFYAPAYGACTWDATSDVGPCIQSAIAAAVQAGGGTVSLPAGTYGISSTVTVTASNVGIRCNHTALKWLGAPGGRMMSVSPHYGDISKVQLRGTSVKGCEFQGNGAADGLYLASLFGWTMENLKFVGPFNGGNVLSFDVVPAVNGTTFGSNINIQDGVARGIEIYNQYASATSRGIYLGSYMTPTGNAGNASYFRIEDFSVFNSGAGTTSIYSWGADNVRFGIGRVFNNGGTAIDLDIATHNVLTTTGNTNSTTSLTGLASTTNLGVGQSVTGVGIANGTTIAAIAGTTVTLSKAATATATGVSVSFKSMFGSGDIVFEQFAAANASIIARGQTTHPGCTTEQPPTAAWCTVGNKILQLDQGNASPVPTVEPGAHLHWASSLGYAVGSGFSGGAANEPAFWAQPGTGYTNICHNAALAKSIGTLGYFCPNSEIFQFDTTFGERIVLKFGGAGPSGNFDLQLLQPEGTGKFYIQPNLELGGRVRPGVVTVATLPACNAEAKHAVMSVSDQSGVPTYRGVLTGGGAIAVLAYCNGTSWEAH